MRASERTTARRKLDKKLISLDNDALSMPPRGWIKAIREALGLTTRQFAKRLGLSQPRAVEIEQAELGGALTLDSLRRAAEALDCRLVYAVVPNEPLEVMAEKRALIKARQRLNKVGHSMALENQAVEMADEEEQLKQLAQKLLTQTGSILWEDD